MKTAFPKQVRPLRKIGSGNYFRDIAHPQCSVGHMVTAIVDEAPKHGDTDDLVNGCQHTTHFQTWSHVYCLVAWYMVNEINAVEGMDILGYGVTSINDEMPHRDRVLLYNLTWAVMGYESRQARATLAHVKGARQYVYDNYDTASTGYNYIFPLRSLKRMVTMNVDKLK